MTSLRDEGGSGVPEDLVVEMIDALRAASDEFEHLRSPEEPFYLNDEDYHPVSCAEVCVRVLERVYAATDDGGRRRLDAMVAEEARRYGTDVSAYVPVLPDVQRQLDEVLESVRRLRLSSPPVDAALRRADDLVAW